jgi:hypothetical protein
MNNPKLAYVIDGKTVYLTDNITGSDVGFIGPNGSSNSTLTLGLVSRDKIEPLVPPKVIPEPPLTLDQQVARAQSIVRVIIEAQYEWDKIQIAKGFAEARNKLLRIPLYRDALWEAPRFRGNLKSLLDEIRSPVSSARGATISAVVGGTGGGGGGAAQKLPMGQLPTKYMRRSATQAERPELTPTQVWELSVDNPNSSVSKFLRVFGKHHGT